MTDIATAIKALKDDAEFVVSGEPSNEAEYKANVKYVTGADSNGTAIFGDQLFTWSQVSAKKAELQTAYDNNEYQRKRASEYPSIADQLDDIYHNGIDGWKSTIKATKDKYPKS
jgi:hypothetical protein|tara:strand:- start:10967 stop:11308 length:342 start_codon:yes stop_codon:yes gene_type:complete